MISVVTLHEQTAVSWGLREKTHDAASETERKAARASVGANRRKPQQKPGVPGVGGAGACPQGLESWDRRPVNHSVPRVLPATII